MFQNTRDKNFEARCMGLRGVSLVALPFLKMSIAGQLKLRKQITFFVDVASKYSIIPKRV